MSIGDSKYADPTRVLKLITDDSGKVIELGGQKDIGEFNDSFLSRVQEGLNYKKIYKEYQKIKTRRSFKLKRDKTKDQYETQATI